MNRRILAAAGGVVVVLVAAWYLALWRPAAHSLAAAQQRLVAAQDDDFSASLQRSALLARKRQLPAIEAQAAALDQAAPVGPDIPGMLDQVAAVAQASGVAWQSESQSQVTASSSGSSTPAAPGATPAGITPISVTFSVTGTRDQVLDFVSRLQGTRRLIKVTSLTLGGAQSGGTQGGSGANPAPSGAVTTQVSATMYEASTAVPSAPRTHG